MTRIRPLLILSALLVLPILDSEAQVYRPPATSSTGVPYFSYVNPGEPSVRLMVMGSATSGMYEVGMETTLAELLVLSNGANISGNSSTSKTVVHVHLYRGDEQHRQVVYSASMEELLTEPGESPRLMEGDVFLVEAVSRNRFQWRDIATTISVIASLTLIFGRIAGRF